MSTWRTYKPVGRGVKPAVAPARPRGMNRWEAAYAQQLTAGQLIGVVRWYAFESLKFRLANKTWYTPDFLVETFGGAMEAHEVKGFWRCDARVKIKVAAVAFPWVRFIAVTRSRDAGKDWLYEAIPNDR